MSIKERARQSPKMSKAHAEEISKTEDELMFEKFFKNHNTRAAEMQKDSKARYQAFGAVSGLTGLCFLHYHIYQSAALALAIFFVILACIMFIPTKEKEKE